MQERIIENLQGSAERCLLVSEFQVDRILRNKKSSDVFLSLVHCYSEESMVQRKACILQSVFKRICKQQSADMLGCVRNYQKVPKNQHPPNVCEGELISFLQCSEQLALIPLANHSS